MKFLNKRLHIFINILHTILFYQNKFAVTCKVIKELRSSLDRSSLLESEKINKLTALEDRVNKRMEEVFHLGL